MVENKQEVSKNLEKALQALEQAKQHVANEKQKPRTTISFESLAEILLTIPEI